MITNRKLFGGMLIVLLAGFTFRFNTVLSANRPVYDGVYSGRLYCMHAKDIRLTLAIEGDKYRLNVHYLDDGDVNLLRDEGRLVYRGDIIEIGRGSDMYYHITEQGLLRQMDRQAKNFIAEEYTLKKV
ncbi:hypothetical protein NO1_1668 [Candidatus Termititenax aidoneus]|uniref:Uncharacterized protein n=1 Tax=Termititenax aidoneus TaxID=2218524 RepID=A0A388TCB9_TERA1|nr:hypothetical protein NO1_1668 [Candidatus Termititenax aidoneus]